MGVSASSLNSDIKNTSQCLQINQSFYISWRIVKEEKCSVFAFIHHKYILQQNMNFIALFSIEFHFHILVDITYKLHNI